MSEANRQILIIRGHLKRLIPTDGECSCDHSARHEFASLLATLTYKLVTTGTLSAIDLIPCSRQSLALTCNEEGCDELNIWYVESGLPKYLLYE